MGVIIEGNVQNPVNVGEPHLPCALVVDTSGSMSGASIQELNQGLQDFITALQDDSQAMGRVEVCVIAFSDNVKVSVPYTPAEEFAAPHFEASGCTAMNEAILTALDMLEDRKNTYKQQGIKYYRPWMFLMTDGEATDTEKKAEALSRLNEYKAKKKINFFPMGIGRAANFAELKEYAGGGAVLKANAANFSEAFVWLSASLSVVSASNPGDAVKTAELPRTIDVLA